MLGKQELTVQWGDETILTLYRHMRQDDALTKALTGTPGTQKWGPDSVEDQRREGGKGRLFKQSPWKWLTTSVQEFNRRTSREEGRKEKGADTVTRKAVLRSLGFIRGL